MNRRNLRIPKPSECDHDNNYGLHGQVICVWCGHVIRRMTPDERARDWTWQGVRNESAMAKVKKLIEDCTPKERPES